MALIRTCAVARGWTIPLLRSERSVSRFVLACMALGFIALIGSAGTAGWFVMKAQDHATWVEHTYEVERRISTLRVLIERLEVARRGYLLSHRQQTKDTFLTTVKDEVPLVSDLRRLTADNPVQQQNLDRFQALAVQHFQLLSRSLVLADKAPELAAAIFTHDQSLGVTRDLRAVTAAMLEEENRLLEQRIAAQREAVNILFYVLAFAGALAVATAIFSILVLRRYTGSLVASREEVLQLADELEDRVEERTRDLSRANEEIQRFAYIVSHDLRSPLVNVMGFTGELEAATKPLAALVDKVEAEAPQLLDQDAAAAAREDLPESIGFIRTSTQKMDRLINAILRLSREGKRVLTPERIDLGQLADAVVASLQHRLDELGAVVTVQRPMPSVVADRLAVEQMLSNLVENAVKYPKPGVPGRIAISAAGDRGRVDIAVADNGRGIDPRDHERIFDLFRRSGQQDQPGEGIGLAHVRALAYRLGGFISCKSALGEGATFTLSLPAQPTTQG
ncbi:CHASE3 domain-containing protein [Sphingomonas sp. CGMCC 1.13654]|uniref:histidine kinase n=1 Tax=Sphingomonas chungangi TaxID=2683589 RepID=A0A838L746_9SPHN|nr:ATP-binding protein [Sphingomonas chungangi]MBA2934964.1 CHASE3 domain-containing protein [Sphingomonas chungangi]MVW58274.1 histidine kinase [Sphingomonas chungangi]